MELLRPVYCHFVVKSFGFFDIRLLKTGQGSYRHMYFVPDNTLTNFKEMLEYVEQWIDPADVLMEISTSGIEYKMSEHDNCAVDKYRHVGLADVKHRLRFGGKRYQEFYDDNHNASLIQFPGDNTWVLLS